MNSAAATALLRMLLQGIFIGKQYLTKNDLHNLFCLNV